MLVAIFKSNQKLVNVLVFILTFLLWIPFFFIDQGEDVKSFLSTGYNWLDPVIAILLLAIQAVYLNVIVNEYKLVEGNSHLTSLLFVLLNLSFLLLFDLNQVAIANTFILLGFHQLLRMYDSKGGFALAFNAGFLISTATTIYSPSAVFLLLLWIGIVYLISPSWRDFVITLIGFSVPIIYLLSYHFVFNNMPIFDLSAFNSIVFDYSWTDLTVVGKINVSVICGIVLMSFMRLTSTMSTGALRPRKMLVMVLLFFAVGLATLLINKMDVLATFIMLTIPLSIVTAIFFQSLKKQWLSELLILIWIVVMVVSYFS